MTPSPWPILSSLQTWSLINCLLISFSFNLKKFTFLFINITLLITSFSWWKNTIHESEKEGFHLSPVIKGIKIGIILFILSEIIFFLSFFWSFFHSSINPSIELGSIWPPITIEPFNPINVPLLNTIILIRSGASLTWSHHSLLNSNLKLAKNTLIITILLGSYFSILQAIEYTQALFSIHDSSYGSVFFIATGFHGAHVIIGSSFLVVNITLLKKIFSSKTHHIGFEIAAWYWHFVDVVWLFLFTSIYWWGK